MARFDSGRFAAYAQRERKRYGAESKGDVRMRRPAVKHGEGT